MADFTKQVDFLNNYADLRGDRAGEILSQLGGAGAFFSSISFVHPNRTPWTIELLAAALRLANHVEMRLKHALACRRPIEFWPQVQPMILTPAHGSLPSGHATEAFISAITLWNLLSAASATNPYGDKELCRQLMRQAARVAINRTVAGVHFPIDSAAGALLGMTLGHYFVARCTNAANYWAWTFDGPNYPDPTSGAGPGLYDGDFHWTALYDVALATPAQIEATKTSASTTKYAIRDATAQNLGAASLILKRLWDKARAEWD